MCKVNKHLWVTLLFSLMLLSSCEKKLDKLLTIDEGIWLAKTTITIIEHEYSDNSEYLHFMSKLRFYKDGTGKSGAEELRTDFTWKLKNEELQFSLDDNILPYKLVSKSKQKMVWEKSFKSNGDYKTYTYTLELIRL